MLTRIYILFFLFQSGFMIAQDISVSGKVMDIKKTPLSFVNVLLFSDGNESPIKGTTTNNDGSFVINGLEKSKYQLKFSYIGFEDIIQTLELTSNTSIGNIILRESAEMLDETVVTTKLPTIQKTAGKLIFNVENTSLSVGSTMDLLKKTPGVVVIGEKIKIKFSTPIIYVNGKRVYLSSDEVASLLENTDAANIKSIEVITNPSAKYDAEAGTVLNIITSKAISIGYKGSVNATYEQAIYPKYRVGTSHFYKNNWLDAYASYSFGKRKEYKEDDNYIRFFQQDEVATKSIWETNFNRTTNSENHNGNVVLDFTLNEKNSLSLASNISVSPNVSYKNKGASLIFSPQRQLDSTITTLSNVDFKKDNLNFNLEYTRKLNDKGATLTALVNYIYYDNVRDQNLSSDYFLANGDFLRNNSFFTNSQQQSNIFTGQAGVSAALWGGTVETGFKFSNIDTESKLDFFDVESNINIFNNALSDDFNYNESIYAEFINYTKDWGKWNMELGLRGEYTDINALSRSLGKVNTQQYFELFPSASFHYTINDNNGIGISYNRSIHRPRYESLNPFKYFITENNFKGGNPNLIPGIEDRITISYDFKNKLFFEAYYQNVKNGLSTLLFQDNENSLLSSLDANLIKSYQYSFDILYVEPLLSWWYLQLETSTYYLADEFYALQSVQETYKNDTFGQFFQLYSNFTLTKDRSFTADITGRYISNYVTGTQYFKNQSFVNISFRKVFWDKRANITVGVDDIFNANNVPIYTKYYNQDNNYFAKPESRLFRLGFKYNFGNARLKDNNKKVNIEESERLE